MISLKRVCMVIDFLHGPDVNYSICSVVGVCSSSPPSYHITQKQNSVSEGHGGGVIWQILLSSLKLSFQYACIGQYSASVFGNYSSYQMHSVIYVDVSLALLLKCDFFLCKFVSSIIYQKINIGYHGNYHVLCSEYTVQ